MSAFHPKRPFAQKQSIACSEVLEPQIPWLKGIREGHLRCYYNAAIPKCEVEGLPLSGRSTQGRNGVVLDNRAPNHLIRGSAGLD